MNFIKYSVIIPHYNDSARLIRMLSSIPLSREDLEVLVVDDCSSDQESLNQVMIKYPAVNWLSTQKNAGAGAARNVGLNHAAGKWLLFADSDDQFTHDAFDIFDRFLSNNDELVYFLTEAVQEVNGELSNRSDRINELCFLYFGDPSEENLSKLKFGHVNPIGKIYSRDFIELHGIRFDEVMVANDVRFNVVAALKARHLQVVLECVYRIYRRPGSLTSDGSGELFLQRVLVQAKLARELQSIGVVHRISATGWMLSSIEYGPSVAFATWRICLSSPMKIKVGNIFNISRWLKFFRTRWRNSLEKKAVQ